MIIKAPYGRDVRLEEGTSVEAFDSAGAIVTPTLESAVRASRQLSGDGAGTGSGAAGTAITSFSDGETVTIRLPTQQQGANVDIVYTMKTTLTPTRGEVLIGADVDASLTNLAHAMNGTGTPGTHYAKGTPPATGWIATADTVNDRLDVDALNHGDAYAASGFAEAAANAAWNTAAAGVDTPDWQEATRDGSGEAAYANMSAAPVVRNDAMLLCLTAAQLSSPRRLRLKENSGTAFEARHIELITTDHPAATKTNGAIYAGVAAPGDLASTGLTLDIPNQSHADVNDWLDGDYSVPDTNDIINFDWLYLFNPDTGEDAWAEIKDYTFDGGAGANQGRITFTVGSKVKNAAALRAAQRLFYLVYQSNPSIAPELGTQAKADANTEVDTALSDLFGSITGAVATDAGNSATGFEVDTSVGTDVRLGVLRLTSGALAGESKLVSWTGTTVTVISQTDMPASMKQFSATPADAVTFTFIPSA